MHSSGEDDTTRQDDLQGEWSCISADASAKVSLGQTLAYLHT